MRHVGRFDPETKLPITEVTQAEFDALPSAWDRGRTTVGMMWKIRSGAGFHKLGYCHERGELLRISWRRLVIVDQSDPAMSPSVVVSSGSVAST